MGISLVVAKIQIIICALAAVALALIFIRRKFRSIEPKVVALLFAVLILSAGYLLVFHYEGYVLPDMVIAFILIELGVFAYIYDALRHYSSEKKSLRHLGSIYILAGVVCILSGRAGFPLLLWVIPVVLFSLGYFFLRNRRGAANICKGAGILVAIAYIAWMLIDVREGTLPGHRGVPLSERLLTEVIKPSITEELNALNEKVASLQNDNNALEEENTVLKSRNETLRSENSALKSETSGLNRRVALLEKEKSTLASENSALKSETSGLNQRLTLIENEKKTLKSELAATLEGKKEAEKKISEADRVGVTADEAVKKTEAEKARLEAELIKSHATLKESELKRAELEKAKETVKESFAGIDEKLVRAAEDLKKAVKERDDCRAEIAALKSRPTPTPPAGLTLTAVNGLKAQLEQKEKKRAELSAEVTSLKETVRKVREAIAVP